MSAQVTSKAEENSYDAILDWATRREAVVKCRASDVYRLRASRSSRGTSKRFERRTLWAAGADLLGCLLHLLLLLCSDDGIFFLDHQPCRMVQVVGWVSAISFDSVHRDALDSDVKVSVTSESFG
jgi:hypothetical protein